MNNRYGLYRTRIGRYFPRYYEGILETDELIKVENDIWNNLYLLLNKAKIINLLHTQMKMVFMLMNNYSK